jgi:hypothetical protein
MPAADARPVPLKNTAYRLYVDFRLPSGLFVSGGVTGADTLLSLDGATFAAATNEFVEIGTTGCGYIDFTAAEMNTDCTVVRTTITNATAIPICITLYPQEADDIRASVTHYGGTAGTFAAGRPEVNVTHAAGTAWGSGAITAASLAGNAITAAKLATDATQAIATAAWGNTTRTLTAGTNITLAKGTGVTGFNDLDAAGIRTAVGLAAANLDTQLGTLATTTSGTKTIADKLDSAMVFGTSTYIFTTAALANAPTGGGGGGATAADIWSYTGGPRSLTDKAGFALAANGLDAAIIEGTTTLPQCARGWNSALLAKVSGLDTNAPVFRSLADDKNRISATTDASGNRTAITRDLT